VDEKEIHAVVEHWKTQGAPVYDPNILRARAEDGDGLPVEDEGPDELYDQAVAALADMRFILHLADAAQAAGGVQPRGPHDRTHGTGGDRRPRGRRETARSAHPPSRRDAGCRSLTVTSSEILT